MIDKLYTYNYSAIIYKGKLTRIEQLSDKDLHNIANKKVNRNITDNSIDNLLTAIFGFDTAEHANDTAEGLFNKLKNRRDNLKLFNSLLDIHLSVMFNPDAAMQAKIATPIGFGKLKGKDGNLAADIDAKRKRRLTRYSPFNALTSAYQETKYINAVAGKQGVAVFSSAMVFIASAENKGLAYVEKVNGKNIFNIRVGDLQTNGDLSNKYTLRGNRLRTKVMEAFQSASVDNEKEQILDKLNVNRHTFTAINGMVSLGFEEEDVVSIIAQDIIFDYVKTAQQMGSSLYEGSRAIPVEDVVRNNWIDRFNEVMEGRELTKENLDAILAQYDDIGINELMSHIEYGEGGPDYYFAQFAVLEKFLTFKKVGEELRNVRSIVSTESAGLGTSFIYTSAKQNAVEDLDRVNTSDNITGIQNAHKLIGTYNRNEDGELTIIPDTILGFATINALFTANSIYTDKSGRPVFPYSMIGFRNIIAGVNRVLNVRGNLLSRSVSDFQHSIVNAAKSYIYTKPELFGITDSNAERERLFFDTDTNYSLATVIEAVKSTPYGKSNQFISRLSTTFNVDGTPSLVRYNASAGSNLDESLIYQDFIRMIVENRPIDIGLDGETVTIDSRELASDLIVYSYLSGGIQEAIEFVRYIPVSILEVIGFGRNLTDIDFNDPAVFGSPTGAGSSAIVGSFVQQFVQHNPDRAYRITNEATVDNEDINDMVVVNADSDNPLYVDAFVAGNSYIIGNIAGTSVFPEYLSSRTENGEYLLYKNIGDMYKRIPTLGVFGMKEYQADIVDNSIIAESTIESRNTTDNLEAVRQPNITTEGTIDNTTTEDNNRVYFENDYNFSTGEALSVLSSIIEKSEGSTKLYATRLLDTLTKLNISPKIKLHSSLTHPGKISKNTKEITIRPDSKKENRDSYIQRVVLHEVTHAALLDIIDTFVAGDSNKLTKSQTIILTRLESLRRVLSMREDIDNIRVSYGLSNLHEFVAQSMTSPEFRQFLENTEWSSDISFWKRLKETLLHLLTELGIIRAIDERKVVSFVEENIFNLLDTLPVNSSQWSNYQRTTPVELFSIEQYKELISDSELSEVLNKYKHC